MTEPQMASAKVQEEYARLEAIYLSAVGERNAIARRFETEMHEAAVAAGEAAEALREFALEHSGVYVLKRQLIDYAP